MESQTDSEEYQQQQQKQQNFGDEEYEEFSQSDESDLNKQNQFEDEYEDEEEGEDEDEAKQLEEEEQKIQETLKMLPFETLLKLKKESKENRQKILKNYQNKDKKEKFQKERIIKRQNEDAPIERDARIQVSRKQTIFASKRQKTRDPRFDQLSGKLDNQEFNKAYGFLDDMKKNEKKVLEKEIKKKKYTSEQKSKLKQELGKIKGDIKSRENLMDKQKVRSQFNKQVIQSVKQGQKPHFAKKSEIKDAELKIKYDKLKSDGKLDKFIQKKRKQKADKLMHAYHSITKKPKFE